MKHTAMPQRTKPMPRGNALERGTGLKRAGRLRPRSKKMAALYEIRRPLVARLLAGRPWCEVRWDAGCQGRSTDVHEPEMRSRGADICDETQCTAVCRHCHDAIHAHPAEATRRGWMVPSKPVSKPWQVTT